MHTARETLSPPQESDTGGAAKAFMVRVKAVTEIAGTAQRGRKSLKGTGTYAHSFHRAIVALTRAEDVLLDSIPDSAEKAPFHDKLTDALEILKSTETTYEDRIDAARVLHALTEVELPRVLSSATGPAIPRSQAVLPMEVVAGTRGYIESLAIQANGCYERKWYDAASMMMRRLVEILIVDVYEAHEIVVDLLDGNQRVRPLSELVSIVRNEPRWHLNKQTVAALEGVRELGNLAAHQRRFKVRKPDIDALFPDFRLAIEELVHLANYK